MSQSASASEGTVAGGLSSCDCLHCSAGLLLFPVRTLRRDSRERADWKAESDESEA